MKARGHGNLALAVAAEEGLVGLRLRELGALGPHHLVEVEGCLAFELQLVEINHLESL